MPQHQVLNGKITSVNTPTAPQLNSGVRPQPGTVATAEWPAHVPATLSGMVIWMRLELPCARLRSRLPLVAALTVLMTAPLGAQRLAADRASVAPLASAAGCAVGRTYDATHEAQLVHAAPGPCGAMYARVGAERSRARGAKKGLLIGMGTGALLGLAITDSFYDGPVVNMAVGAGAFGLLGALIGAAVGSAPPAS